MSGGKSTVTYRLIPDFPGYYAGDDGSVWSRQPLNGIGPLVAAWRQLRPHDDKYGYPQVTLHRERKAYCRKIHRLVLEAFVGTCPPGMQCRHFPDQNRSNCALPNLSWGTPKQNAADRVNHGTAPVGERNPAAKLTETQVRTIRAEYATGMFTQRQLAAKYGRSQGTIAFVLRGGTWKHVI